METIDILIADDHRMFAEGLESILGSEPGITVSGVAKNGAQLMALLKQHTPDVVLLDISMPEMDGMEAASQILKQHPTVKILVLTMHNTEDYILPLVQKGVHGYVLKNAGRTELLEGIKRIKENGNYYSAEITSKLVNGLRQYEASALVKLSTREAEVLELVMEGLSTAEIADKLFISPRTVETHRSNLLAKTESKNTAQLIKYAQEKGLLRMKPVK